jgi:hypothetical protein
MIIFFKEYYSMGASKFIQDQKKLYKSLKPTYCPVLQQTIYFNSTGLNHILYNRRRPRNHNEQHYRAGLISHISEVISKATQAVKVIKSEKPLVITWSIQHVVNDTKGVQQLVKVILIKNGDGNPYFLSVMAKRNNGKVNKQQKETKKPRNKF